MSALVHVHCSACDWDGMGEEKDFCYRCGESDSLKEVDPQDEHCIHCGQCMNQCECDEDP